MRTIGIAAAVLIVATTGALAQTNPSELKWGPAPPAFPAGAEMAVLSGDPGKAGPFAVRLRVPAGFKVPAHSHPTDEFVTVISGEVSLGMGDKLDQAKGKRLEAGGFAEAKAGMNHYVWTRSGAIVQVNSEGPFEMTYADPADDPRKAK